MRAPGSRITYHRRYVEESSELDGKQYSYVTHTADTTTPISRAPNDLSTSAKTRQDQNRLQLIVKLMILCLDFNSIRDDCNFAVIFQGYCDGIVMVSENFDEIARTSSERKAPILLL